MIQWSNHLSGWRVSGVVTCWGAAIFGVLQLHHLPLEPVHSVCGPWGCLPPLQALAAYHGFWLVLLSLPAGLACRFLVPSALKKLGLLLVVCGVLGLAGIAIRQYFSWLPYNAIWRTQYCVQRYLYEVATLVDVPVVQGILSGVTCLLIARLRKSAGIDRSFESSSVELAEAAGQQPPSANLQAEKTDDAPVSVHNPASY